MSRVYNFSAGPSALPEAVLLQAREELPDWRHSGLSVMEMSHRGKDFVGIAEQAEADLRSLLAIPAKLQQRGGVPAIEVRNRRKAELLYQAIDTSGFYSNPVDPRFRSRMNVPFRLADPDLEKPFLAEAKQAGLVNLEGHRSVGGLRASIYNAMPEQGVLSLIAFMQDFERRRG